jgi:hypothetical protein
MAAIRIRQDGPTRIWILDPPYEDVAFTTGDYASWKRVLRAYPGTPLSKPTNREGVPWNRVTFAEAYAALETTLQFGGVKLYARCIVEQVLYSRRTGSPLMPPFQLGEEGGPGISVAHLVTFGVLIVDYEASVQYVRSRINDPDTSDSDDETPEFWIAAARRVELRRLGDLENLRAVARSIERANRQGVLGPDGPATDTGAGSSDDLAARVEAVIEHGGPIRQEAWRDTADQLVGGPHLGPRGRSGPHYGGGGIFAGDPQAVPTWGRPRAPDLLDDRELLQMQTTAGFDLEMQTNNRRVRTTVDDALVLVDDVAVVPDAGVRGAVVHDALVENRARRRRGRGRGTGSVVNPRGLLLMLTCVIPVKAFIPAIDDPSGVWAFQEWFFSCGKAPPTVVERPVQVHTAAAGLPRFSYRYHTGGVGQASERRRAAQTDANPRMAVVTVNASGAVSGAATVDHDAPTAAAGNQRHGTAVDGDGDWNITSAPTHAAKQNWQQATREKRQGFGQGRNSTQGGPRPDWRDILADYKDALLLFLTPAWQLVKDWVGGPTGLVLQWVGSQVMYLADTLGEMFLGADTWNAVKATVIAALCVVLTLAIVGICVMCKWVVDAVSMPFRWCYRCCRWPVRWIWHCAGVGYAAIADRLLINRRTADPPAGTPAARDPPIVDPVV